MILNIYKKKTLGFNLGDVMALYKVHLIALHKFIPSPIMFPSYLYHIRALGMPSKVDDDKITSSGLNWSSIPITGSNTSTSPGQRKYSY